MVAPGTSVQRFGVSVSDSVIVSLKLNTIANETTAGNTSRLVLKGNDAFSPDPSFPSRQPIGFDQWTNMYKKYEVLSSSISTRIVNLSILGPINWSVYPTFDTGVDLVYGDGAAQKYAKIAYCDMLGSGKSDSRIFNKMGTYKLLGRISTSLNYAALVTTSPLVTWDWIYEFINPEGSALFFSFQTNITYVTRFFERKAFVDF